MRKLEIELTDAQLAMLEFLIAGSDHLPRTPAGLAHHFIIEALKEQLSDGRTRAQWAHWCLTGTFPTTEDD
jgi:hypothetical protein